MFPTCCGGLAGIDVRHDTDVANASDIERLTSRLVRLVRALFSRQRWAAMDTAIHSAGFVPCTMQICYLWSNCTLLKDIAVRLQWLCGAGLKGAFVLQHSSGRGQAGPNSFQASAAPHTHKERHDGPHATDSQLPSSISSPCPSPCPSSIPLTRHLPCSSCQSIRGLAVLTKANSLNTIEPFQSTQLIQSTQCQI